MVFQVDSDPDFFPTVHNELEKCHGSHAATDAGHRQITSGLASKPLQERPETDRGRWAKNVGQPNLDKDIKKAR